MAGRNLFLFFLSYICYHIYIYKKFYALLSQNDKIKIKIRNVAKSSVLNAIVYHLNS